MIGLVADVLVKDQSHSQTLTVAGQKLQLLFLYDEPTD